MNKILTLLIISFSFISCLNSNTNKAETHTTKEFAVLKETQKMDTVYFWKIMDYGFQKGKFDNKIREEAILEQLVKLTPEQIQMFEIIFQQMNNKSSTYGNLAAQIAIEGGTSDDRFYYFRCWLISLGEKIFEETLKNPDYLATLDIPKNEMYQTMYCQFEELIPMADHAYYLVTKDAPLDDSTYPRSNARKLGLFYDSGTEMKGVEWQENELPKIVPQLYKKYGGQYDF